MIKKIANDNPILNNLKLKKLKLLFIIFLCSNFSYGQSTYNVTFSVNTTGTTVGPNGIYAGAGILGGANAVPLSDPNGTGIWTGSVTLPSGLTGPFAFFNSPANGSDWGTKENLIGQSCADPNNFNDRTLPIILADTTLIYCFGSCNSVCPVYGCTDPSACNYDSQATINDGSCITNCIYNIISNSADHTTLKLSIDACGLTGTLKGPGPFTFFAPTDAAFNTLSTATVTSLLSNLPLFTDMLLNHVVGDSVMSSMLSNGQTVTTLEGSDVTVTITGGNVYINSAMVTVADIVGDNGVVHVIDAVLLPPTPSNINELKSDDKVIYTVDILGKIVVDQNKKNMILFDIYESGKTIRRLVIN